jgi:hypothetical protein
MILHSLWRADAAMGYVPTHCDYNDRPWVLDSWDDKEWNLQRRYLPAEHTGLLLRSIKTLHRVTIESSIAMEQYT